MPDKQGAGSDIEKSNKMETVKLSASLAGIHFFDDVVKLSDNGDLENLTLSWVQACKVGVWNGHSSGGFEFNDDVFGQIIKNFRRTLNRALPLDFEHASEMPGYAGSIPTEGAPATGWVIDLQNRGAQGLWALIAWLEPGLSLVRSKRYRYLSPAVIFHSYDRSTGDYIGCEMTSIALTNRPFLDGMAAVTARRTTNMPDETSKDSKDNKDNILENALRVALGDNAKPSFEENMRYVGDLVAENATLKLRVEGYEKAEREANEKEVDAMVSRLVACGAISQNGIEDARKLALSDRKVFNAMFAHRLSGKDTKADAKAETKPADKDLSARSTTELNDKRPTNITSEPRQEEASKTIEKIALRIAATDAAFRNRDGKPNQKAQLKAITEFERGIRE